MIMIQNLQHSQAKYVIKIFKRLFALIVTNKGGNKQGRNRGTIESDHFTFHAQLFMQF